MPVARGQHTATAVDGKIYVLGGRITDSELVPTNRVDVYDPAADSWQQMAAMPTARSSHAAAVLDGKIYVTGGNLNGHRPGVVLEYSDALEAYDPVNNTWTTLASLSEYRASHASTVVNGKLYVFGGYSDSGRMDLVEVYSPASNSWASAASVPSVLKYAVAVAL